MCHHTTRVPRSRRAFTLLEVMVVVVILSVMAVASVSVWVTYHRDSLVGGESGKISRLLALARNYAVANGSRYQVTFWPEEMAYWIDEIDGSGAVVTPKVVAPERMDRQIEIDQVVGGTLTFSGACVSLRFEADGSSDAATIHVIEKTADHSDNTQYYTIKLYAPTGKSAVFENQRI